jgi:hypothetical protein
MGVVMGEDGRLGSTVIWESVVITIIDFVGGAFGE